MLQGQPERRSRQGFPGSFSCPFWPFNWGIGRCWKHLISWTTSTSDTFCDLSWQYESYRIHVEADVQVRQCESFKHLFIANIAQLWWYIYSRLYRLYRKHHWELIPPNVKSKSTLQEPLFGQMERATSVSLVKTTFTALANTGPLGFQAELLGWMSWQVADHVAL